MLKFTSETVNESRKAIFIQDVMSNTSSTSMSIKTLMSLQNMIVQHDILTLDETNKRNLEKHLKKLIKVVEVFYAKNYFKKIELNFCSKSTINHRFDEQSNL